MVKAAKIKRLRLKLRQKILDGPTNGKPRKSIIVPSAQGSLSLVKISTKSNET